MGAFLIAIILLAAGLALVTLGVGASKRNDRPKTVKKLGAAKSPAGQGSARVASHLAAEEGEDPAEIILSTLRIPPPDEKRIEAVAPKNDRPAPTGRRL